MNLPINLKDKKSMQMADLLGKKSPKIIPY